MKNLIMYFICFLKKILGQITVSKKGDVFGIVTIDNQPFLVYLIPIGNDSTKLSSKNVRGPNLTEFNIIIKYFWCIFCREKTQFFSQPTKFTDNFFIIKTTPASNLSITKEITNSFELELEDKDSLKNFIEIKKKFFKEKTLTPKTYKILIEPL